MHIFGSILFIVLILAGFSWLFRWLDGENKPDRRDRP
jgi:hypothetical protein